MQLRVYQDRSLKLVAELLEFLLRILESRVVISIQRLAILTEVYRGTTQYLQANTKMS
jgi:hypothetical protein